jgi:hypothetical protein
VCLGWRVYIPSLVSVLLDLGLVVTKLISFILNKVTVDGRSMFSMYVDYGFGVMSLVAYPPMSFTIVKVW